MNLKMVKTCSQKFDTNLTHVLCMNNLDCYDCRQQLYYLPFQINIRVNLRFLSVEIPQIIGVVPLGFRVPE